MTPTSDNPVALTSAQLALIRRIVAKRLPDATVRIFGSRARAKAKPHSDLDLLVESDAPLTLRQRRLLADDFDESPLPFRVDIVEYAELNNSFAASILARSAPLAMAKPVDEASR
ncbi:MAG TPA: nucleotidyltransferase domain-containing protein [Gammaproteobacteria bacterium]|nr:nucleotidyltransferase domain-containing protein [Gammaproteobacteria bacterium]